MTHQLLLVELNEVNFDFVRYYADRGYLPVLGEMIGRHGLRETTSEERHEHLEPWIQWVTAHTGQSFAEHGIFRLGDIVHHEIPQIWEEIERAGFKVGAVSPMNARNRLRRSPFFLPDPWTSTPLTAPPRLAQLHRAIAQAVNDNAQSRVTAHSLLALLSGTLAYAAPANYGAYLGLAASSRSSPWRRALFLDLLLSDVFLKEVRRTRVDFATFFLNAAAHIQHHYMFCSAAYQGKHRNPPWYVRSDADPVLEVLQLYDRILRRIRTAFPDARLLIATGLHQEPHEHLTFYWRLREHEALLRKIRVPFGRVEPRMSRDFLVICDSTDQAQIAERRLRAAIAADGLPLFEVDNRGRDLFVMLTYPREITANFDIAVEEDSFTHFERDVAFVAIKNGEHDGVGYFIDTALSRDVGPLRFPLAELPQRIASAMNAEFIRPSLLRTATEASSRAA